MSYFGQWLVVHSTSVNLFARSDKGTYESFYKTKQLLFIVTK